MRYFLIIPLLFLFSCHSKLDNSGAADYSDTALYQAIKGGYATLKSVDTFVDEREFEFTNNPWDIQKTDTICIRFSKHVIYYGPFQLKGIARFSRTLKDEKDFMPRLYVQRKRKLYLFSTDLIYQMQDRGLIKFTFATSSNDWTSFKIDWDEVQYQNYKQKK